MNTKLALSLAIVAGVAFAGCQAEPVVTNPEPITKATVSASVEPTAKPSTAPVTKEEAEVESIEAEFKNIDASKDFPDFTQNDLQQ